jgi:hypothetical protein
MVEEFLLALARMTELPDVEFIINYSDFPQLLAERHRGVVFSMSKTPAHTDILLPTYETMQTALGRRPAPLTSCHPPSWAARRAAVIWR